MKNRFNLILKLIVCSLLIFNITGCWNRRELNTLAIVMGIGIDKTQEQGKIQVTAQVVKPSALKSSTSEEGDGGKKAYWNLKNTGDTIFEILRGFTHESSRRLFFPHIQVLILGRDFAEEGVQKQIDFFIRDHETRLGVWVLVSKNKASEVLDVTPELDKIPAMNIAKLVQAQTATSQTSIINLEQFITRLMSKTTAPIAPLIEISDEEKEKTLRVEGTAVFKKDKLAGQLNKSETRGLLWIIDEIKSGIIDVDCPNSDGKVSLEIIRSKGKITPEIKDNKLYIKIDIKEEAAIGSQSCDANLGLEKTIEALERKQSDAIQNEVMIALKKARKLNTDIFGFGDAIHRKYPEEWKEFENRWDEIFPDIEVELIVESKLRKTGRISRPAAPEKE